MTAVFEKYKSRKIKFSELLNINDWSVKLYSITNKDDFHSFEILENIKEALPVWLSDVEHSRLTIYRKSFLIVHEAREGVWVLLNWWTGGEMIQTEVFLIEYDKPDFIKKSPYTKGSLLCVWELEVFAHERKSWIKHVLKKSEAPKFDDYLKDVLKND